MLNRGRNLTKKYTEVKAAFFCYSFRNLHGWFKRCYTVNKTLNSISEIERHETIEGARPGLFTTLWYFCCCCCCCCCCLLWSNHVVYCRVIIQLSFILMWHCLSDRDLFSVVLSLSFCDHSYESYWAVVYCGSFWFTMQCGSNFCVSG